MSSEEGFKIPVEKYTYVLSTEGHETIKNNGITDIVLSNELSWFTVKRPNKHDLNIEAGKGIVAIGVCEELFYLFGKDNNNIWTKTYLTSTEDVHMVYHRTKEGILQYRLDESSNQDVIDLGDENVEYRFDKLYILPNCTIKVKK
jgi:hypothetical protein